MSRKGNYFDNAVDESFFGTLNAEYFHLATLDGLHDLDVDVNDYIHSQFIPGFSWVVHPA